MLSGRSETDFLVGKEVCSNLDLAQAIDHIENYFPVVGLTESFDQSVNLINYVYGLNLYPGFKKNVTNSRPTLSEINQDTLIAIQEVNAYDIELYHYCVNRFEKMINSRKIQLFFLPLFSKANRKIKTIVQKNFKLSVYNYC